MSSDLTDVFGNEIKVTPGPHLVNRQFTTYPGVHGATTMFMSSAGRPLVIAGRLRASGDNYAAARAALQAKITALSAFQWAGVEDYTFKDDTYSDVVFEELTLVADRQGKTIHFNTAGEAHADFVMRGRALT